MRMPLEVLEKVRAEVARRADEVAWHTLSDLDRVRFYDEWTRADAIGGVLGHFMDPRKVRVYLKDTLMKRYLRGRSSRVAAQIRGALSNALKAEATQLSTRPALLRLASGPLVGWGNWRDREELLVAMFRMNRIDQSRAVAILIDPENLHQGAEWKVVEDMSRRLGVDTILAVPSENDVAARAIAVLGWDPRRTGTS